MPYVHRNEHGKVTTVTRWPNGSDEFLPDDNPEVVAITDPPPLPPQFEQEARDIEKAPDLAAVQAILAKVLRRL